MALMNRKGTAMTNDCVVHCRIVIAVIGMLSFGLPGWGLPSEMTLCDCANTPIKTDAQAAACSQLTRRFTPEVLATETLKCREALAVPKDGLDICFCMRSNSQDPNVQQACRALVNRVSPGDMYAVTKDCAKKQYQRTN